MSVRTPRRQHGVTLVEAAVVVAVAAVLAATALPSFRQARETRRLEAVAAQLETDLQLARALAVARNEGVRMGFAADAAGSCYVVHTGGAGDCGCSGTGTARCSAGAEALRVVALGADRGVRIDANTHSMQFDPAKGTVTPTATLRVTAASGSAIHQVVNVMGRIRSCTPTAGLAGYRRC